MLTSTAIWFAAVRCNNSCEVSLAFFGSSLNWESFFRTGLSSEGVVPKHCSPSVMIWPMAKSGSAWNIFWKFKLVQHFQNNDLPWQCPLSPPAGDLQSDRSSGEGENRTSWQPCPRELKKASHRLSCLPNPCGDPESWPQPSSLEITGHYQPLPAFLKGYLWPQCPQCSQCSQVRAKFGMLSE